MVADGAGAFLPGGGLTEAGRGADECERGDALGVVDGEVAADGAAEGDAGVGEAVDAEVVGEVEDEPGEAGDARPGRQQGGGRTAVAGQVVAHDAVVAGELGHLGVPDGERGAEGGAEEEGGCVAGAVGAVVQEGLGHGCSLRARSTRIPAAPV